MACKIIRRKLITLGTMTFGGGPININGQEWREEECGAPIFGKWQQIVCPSCLKGWWHENNFMIDSEENNALLKQARAATPQNA